MQAKSLIRTVTVIEVPADALRLNEDIQALVRIQRELRWLDPASVAEDAAKGRRMIRFVTGQIKMAERHARARMQAEYLCAKPGKKNIKRDTT